MDKEKRQKIIFTITIITCVITVTTLFVRIFKPQIWKLLEKDKLAAFIICENWKFPSRFEGDLKGFNRDQSADAKQTNIENILKVKSLDHLLIYNTGDEVIPELYITISESEYAEIVKKGKIVDEIEGEILYRPLGRLFIDDDVRVRVWRCCFAEEGDSKSGVFIHQGVGKGRPPKISFLTPSVVDFDNWIEKLVESKNNSLFTYSLLSGFGFLVLLLMVLLWKRRKRRLTKAT